MNSTDGASTRNVSLQDKPEGGPGGPVVDVLLMLAPLVFLLIVTISKRLSLPTSHSVPIAAAALYLLKLCYIGTPANPVSAALLQGALLGLVPLSILFGAFTFYNVLDLTQCTAYVSMLVKQLCHDHPVSEVFLIVWGLGHAIEGASGFGTPGALLPPIAAGLGHDPFHSVLALLVATSTVGPFGSSGAPIWFGLAALSWPRKELVHASFLVSVTLAVMSYPIGIMAARYLLSWEDIRGCWLFVFLSITAGAIPALAVALFSFEVPALLSEFHVGLSDDIPAMAARRRKLSQEQQVAIEIPADATGQLELATMAAPGAAFDCPPGVPTYKQHPSFPTLRSRTVSAEGGGSAAPVQEDGGTALQLLSMLHSPRRRTSQQQGGSREGSRASTSASAEALLLAPRSVSAPSFAELAKLSAVQPQPQPQLLPQQQAGAAATAAKPRGPSSQKQLLPASAGSGTGAAGPGSGSGRHVRVIPWLMMLAVVAGTRVPYLQRSNGHELVIPLRSLCDILVSSNLVITVSDILRAGTNWSYACLYVPSLLPFVMVGCVTLALFHRDIPEGAHWSIPFKKSWAKCKSVMMAMLSALVLVALMVQGERQSPAFIIGYWLSTWLRGGYIAVAMCLGAMGAFFSGSVATSNLTFGLLQQVAAMRLGFPGAPMLMLQVVGGAAGQMVSISNILGARAVMGLTHIPEGRFVNAALPACLMYYVVTTLLSLPFLLA